MAICGGCGSVLVLSVRFRLDSSLHGTIPVFYPMKFLAVFSSIVVAMVSLLPAEDAKKPNIIFILCDDLGYGDVQCLNPDRGKIPTPRIDQLAQQGMTFTDAHSSSSVCTPTRYNVLTGRYNWRTKLQKGVLFGFSEPLIDKDRLTVPALLKQQGYHSACIGKWHLGLDIAKTDGEWDWSKPIANGPVDRGFDHYYGISASLDMPPYAWIDDRKFTEDLTTTKKWVRSGPAAESFEAEDVLPELAKKAGDYIAERAKTKEPFFLYLPLASPHTPILPTKEWQGKSEIGPYGDFVMQTDWALGVVMDAVEKAGIEENTLIVFTSDNGCAPYIGVSKFEQQGHFPSGNLRGYKADAWDGGHRVPFIAQWKGKIKAGSQYAGTVCLGDLMATSAELSGAKLPETAGEDSVSIVPALMGEADGQIREATVHHSIGGKFAIRKGKWKLLFCAGSGGWTKPNDKQAAKDGLPKVQLYDMEADIAEQKNLQAEHPEVVKELTELLESYVARGRSTPGPALKNDAEIDIRKN